MKFYATDNKMVSLENVLNITCNEIIGNKHTHQGKAYYLYDCMITIGYVGTTSVNRITFHEYKTAEEALSAQKKVFNELLEILKK